MGAGRLTADESSGILVRYDSESAALDRNGVPRIQTALSRVRLRYRGALPVEYRMGWPSRGGS